MLWTNKRTVTDYDGSRHVEFDIHITRGDTGYLELIPKRNGVVYSVTDGDVVALQVRANPIKSDAETELIFSGNVTVESGKPIWHLTTANTTRNCGVYYWDVQLTSNGEISTYAMGKLYIEEEKTV